MNGWKMEEDKTEQELLLERLIDDAKNYTSGYEAALDHINMGYIHLFKQLDGDDEDGLLLGIKEISQKITNLIIDSADDGNNV
jgi:hypothetical protein